MPAAGMIAARYPCRRLRHVPLQRPLAFNVDRMHAEGKDGKWRLLR